MNYNKMRIAVAVLVVACGAFAGQAKGDKYTWETDLQHRLHYDFGKSRDEVL